MKKFETIKKATVYKMAGNKYEPTGKIIPPKTIINGYPIAVQVQHGNPIDFIQISGFGKVGTPTYVFPSDVKPFGAIPSKSSNFTEGDALPATATDWAKELFSIVISLAVLFLLVFVISKAWKMGQTEKTGTVKA